MRRVVPLLHRLPQGEPPHPRRRYEAIKGVAVHHSGRADSTPWTVARYHTLPEKDGGRGWPTIGYPFVVHRGELYQTGSLEWLTNHAGAFNASRLGILITGDYDETPPSEEDRFIAADLASLVLIWIGQLDPFAKPDGYFAVAGHHELGPGATAREVNTCPGKQFPLASFRTLVGQVIAARQDFDSHKAELVMREAAIDI